MGRPPLEKKQRQLPVALPEDVRAELEAAALKSGHSVAEEIRRRITLTLEADAHDTQTRALAADVAQLAEQINREKGFAWHSHEKAFETLVSAINAWLAGIKPKRRDGVGASDLMWGDDDPATLGRSIARHHQGFKAALEKSTDEMRKLHEGKEP